MALITRDLQIADKPTLDDVKSMLQNGTYGLNALKNMLGNGTYGLSALKTKLNNVGTDAGKTLKYQGCRRVEVTKANGDYIGVYDIVTLLEITGSGFCLIGTTGYPYNVPETISIGIDGVMPQSIEYRGVGAQNANFNLDGVKGYYTYAGMPDTVFAGRLRAKISGDKIDIYAGSLVPYFFKNSIKFFGHFPESNIKPTLWIYTYLYE